MNTKHCIFSLLVLKEFSAFNIEFMIPIEIIMYIVSMISKKIKLIATTNLVSLIIDGEVYEWYLPLFDNNHSFKNNSPTKLSVSNIKCIRYWSCYWVALTYDNHLYSGDIYNNDFSDSLDLSIKKNNITKIHKIFFESSVVVLQYDNVIHLLTYDDNTTEKSKITSININFFIKKMKTTKSSIIILDNLYQLHIYCNIIYDFSDKNKITVKNIKNFNCCSNCLSIIDRDDIIYVIYDVDFITLSKPNSKIYKSMMSNAVVAHLSNVINIYCSNCYVLFMISNSFLKKENIESYSSVYYKDYMHMSYWINSINELPKINISNIYKMKCTNEWIFLLTTAGIHFLKNINDENKKISEYSEFIKWEYFIFYTHSK